MDGIKTLQQAVVYFTNFENCKKMLMELRWPDGVVKCPHCGSEKVTYLAKPRVWKCYTGHPKPKFSLKTGTIFEDSPLGLDKWLVGMWLIANCKNGISSCEIARALGVTQKTAWFMDHRIRLSMQDFFGTKLGGSGGEIEADESFIGGKARNMHKHIRAKRITKTGGGDKDMAFGMLERGGQVRTMVLPDRQSKTVDPVIKEHVHEGAALFTDAMLGYRGLDADYMHQSD
ncbi:MAG: IS1595 family transposase [Acidobacteriaceae bacterium]